MLGLIVMARYRFPCYLWSILVYRHLFGTYVLIFTMEELTDDRATKNYNQIEFYVGGLSIDVALER